MTRRLMAATVLAVALAVMPAGAQGPGPHPGALGMHGIVGPPMEALGPIVQMLQTLDLTDVQKQEIHSTLMQTLENDDSGKQIIAATQQLHAAVLADVPDPQAIDTIKATLNTVHAAELNRHVDLMVKIAQILTPDQRQQLLKLHPPAPGR